MSKEDNEPKLNRPDDPHEEDVIFPMDVPEDNGKLPSRPIPKPRQKTSVFILIIFFFALGYAFNSPVFKNARLGIEKLAMLTKEKAEPFKQSLTEKLKFKNKPSMQMKKIKGGNDDSTGMSKKSKRKIKYWQAPMNPSFTADKPGKSPMGMDLVPVYEDEGGEDSGIRIKSSMVQNIGVKTTVAKVKVLRREIRTVGNLTYDERKVTHIHTKYEGWIEKLYVDFTGQEVKEDDMLVEIYSPELVSTQEEFLLAMKYEETLKDNQFSDIAGGAKTLLESSRRRLELFDVPEHQIEELIRNKKITKTMHIHSPVRGFVIKKEALQGIYVKPGKSLYTIADLSNIWVLADIYEFELPWIRVGQKATMNLSYFPGKTFQGKVTFIDPIVNPKTRTVKVRMEFSNPNWRLKPDMYADIVIKSPVSKKTVALPEEAVIHSGQKNLVIVQNKSGSFDSREVILGVASKGEVQIIKGVKAGETVVTSSNFLIDSESNLKGAINKMRESKKVQNMSKEP